MEDLLEDKEILDSIINILDKRIEESCIRADNIIYLNLLLEDNLVE